MALANANRWDFDEPGEFQRRLEDAALALPSPTRIEHILKVTATQPTAGFELGRTLNTVGSDHDEITSRLI